MAMRFRSMCSKMTLDGLVLPIHNHGLGTFASIAGHGQRSKMVLCPLSEWRMRSTWRGSTANRLRGFARAVDDGGNFAFTAHTPGMIFGSGFPGHALPKHFALT